MAVNRLTLIAILVRTIIPVRFWAFVTNARKSSGSKVTGIYVQPEKA